jgi:hypothetical protein
MNSCIEQSMSRDGSVPLSVLDRLTACRTENDLAQELEGILRAGAPEAQIAVVLDPERPNQSAIQRMASAAWQAGVTVRGTMRTVC